MGELIFMSVLMVLSLSIGALSSHPAEKTQTVSTATAPVRNTAASKAEAPLTNETAGQITASTK